MGTFGRFVSRLADGARLRDPAVPRPYDDRDRLEQLRRCARLATDLGDLHARHGRPPAGYGHLADEARRLLTRDDRTPEELRALAHLMPPAAGWMNARAVDSGLRVEPWQTDATERHFALAGVILELRATARYGDAR